MIIFFHLSVSFKRSNGFKMSFLTKVSSFVSQTISTFNRTDNDSVKEISPKTLGTSLAELIAERNGFTLYFVVKEKLYHLCHVNFTKTYSLYRSLEKADALDRLEIFGHKSVLFRFVADEESLKKLVATIHLHPHWEPIHFACLLGYLQYIDSVRSEMPK